MREREREGKREREGERARKRERGRERERWGTLSRCHQKSLTDELKINTVVTPLPDPWRSKVTAGWSGGRTP